MEELKAWLKFFWVGVTTVLHPIKETHEDTDGSWSWIRVVGSIVIGAIMAGWLFALIYDVIHDKPIPEIPWSCVFLIGCQLFSKLMSKLLELKLLPWVKSSTSSDGVQQQ